jgi:hypothetical protein
MAIGIAFPKSQRGYSKHTERFGHEFAHHRGTGSERAVANFTIWPMPHLPRKICGLFHRNLGIDM